jgi:CHAT domain-containing protein
MPLLENRNRSGTRISYILLTKRDDNVLPIVPTELRSEALELIRTSPRDIIQFFDPEKYYQLYFKLRHVESMELLVVYDSDADRFIESLSKSNLFLVFIVDQYSKDTVKKLLHTPDFLYLTSGHESILQAIKHDFPESASVIFDNPSQYFEYLRRDKNRLLMRGSARMDSITRKKMVEKFENMKRSGKALVNLPDFKPALSSYFIYNQIYGDYWHLRPKQHRVNPAERHPKLVELAKVIDKTYMLLHKLKVITRLNAAGTSYCPIILIFPFHNPNFKKIILEVTGGRSFSGDSTKINGKDYAKFFGVEQNIHFLHLIYETKGESHESHAAKFVKYKLFEALELSYLDIVGYLHATFKFSPLIRFPIRGTSLNSRLAPFSPRNFSRRKNFKKLAREIYSFGKRLNELTMSNEMVNYLKARNGQIVALSDLPIEWLQIDGVPLAFQFDICRIPTSPPARVMAHYAVNSYFRYQVPRNILKKTLIVFGSPANPEFNMTYAMTEHAIKSQYKFPVKIARTRSKRELADVIQRCEPDFLILDTHGNFEERDGSSYIMINGEKLTGDDIVNLKIRAPLVFLSACFTNPTYGYLNSLAYGFFETGSLSVVTSLLPLSLLASTVLYLRLLRNLSEAATTPLHENWLSLVSHTVRTSLATQAYENLSAKVGEMGGSLAEAFDIADLHENMTNWHFKSMVFSTRKEAFESWQDIFLSSLKESRFKHPVTALLKSNRILPEYLFYSHLGRPDLITFKAHEKLKR